MDAFREEIRRVKNDDFVKGCIDSLPVCLAFMFMFFSIGVLLATAGFSLFQSVIMTLTVHAAPLQVFVGQSDGNIGVWALIMITLVVNFRFMIMSSVLCEQFKSVSLAKMMWSVQLLSVSTFTLANARKGDTQDNYRYFLGCGLSSLFVAVLATFLGYVIRADLGMMAYAVIAMILPIHFTALVGMSWPKWRPVIATAIGFVATPIVGAWLGVYHVFIVPLLLGAVFLFAGKVSGKAS
ncbi:AzlC family ABC transporter permease [Pseudomonas sp. 681]|uniref:AzlC family ABC transporter permease n=1 Tax=Pseudomonas fungipugnans TaxID=3024217 RepID=A0ABT6QMG4_9PSED|nr:AzlC family ABC transporter permease [Pseudomonas sp. 681]MDI2592088.1 AzlC family ABC transporter permease [Pseudomonas sp. 681]